MAEEKSQTNTADSVPTGADAAPDAPLSGVTRADTAPGARFALEPLETAAPPSVLLATARQLSKAGRLPGFRPRDARSFTCSVFGTTYDRTMHVQLVPTEGGHARAEFSCSLNKRLPAIVIVVLILTIWPGVLILHSMLTKYFLWYFDHQWQTWAWYVPVTLLALPVAWKQFKLSEAAAREHADEVRLRLANAFASAR